MAKESPKAVLMVLSNCADPARDQDFKEWYTDIHFP